jgi:small-conductance mechanosensitive channel
MLEKINLGQLIEKIPVFHVALTIILFAAAILASKLLKKLASKRLGKKAEREDSFWHHFWKAERRLILKSIGLIIWIAFIGAVLFIWSSHIERLFAKLEYLYPPLVKAAFIIIFTIVALKVTHHLIRFMVESVTPMAERRTVRGKQRMQTLNHVFRYGGTILILLIAALMLLDTFGISLKAVLATVGIASLAIGFGAQSLVKDLVSGIFILAEDQFAVGDVVIINGEGGLVEKMTLRITQLRNTQGMLITIPSGSVEMVKNLTSEWSRVDYMIGVAYETDLDHAMSVVMDEAGKLKADMAEEIIDDPELMGVDEFGDSSITLRVWIKTAPLQQWKVKRELNRRVHKRFEQEGITIPFPQRTVWIKEPKESLLAALAEKRR